MAVTLEQAIERHRAGDVAGAVATYRAALAADPGNWLALHFMGVASYQLGNAAAAVRLLADTVARKPDYAEAHSNLGIALMAVGRAAEAASAQRRALALNPALVPAQYNLGLALHRLGQLDAAVAALRVAAERQPDAAAPRWNLGLVLLDSGELAASETAFRDALALEAGDADAWHGLARLLYGAGRFDEALAAYDASLAARPNFAEAALNRSMVLVALQRIEAGLASYRQAVGLNRDLLSVGHNVALALAAVGEHRHALDVLNEILAEHGDLAAAQMALGTVLIGQRDWAGAIGALQAAVRLAGDNADAYALLGQAFQAAHLREEALAAYRGALAADSARTMLHAPIATLHHELGQLPQAIEHYELAIAAEPGFATGYSNMGCALREFGRFDEAVAACAKAVALDRESSGYLTNLSLAQESLGRIDEAMASLHRALELDATQAAAYNGLGNILKDLGRLDEALANYRDGLAHSPSAGMHSNLLLCLNYRPGTDRQAVFAAHRDWDGCYGMVAAEPTSFVDRDLERRLRVGLVSADFRNHVTIHFLDPLFATYDRARLELFCYSTATVHDPVSQRLWTLGDHWLLAGGMSDAELDRRIRADRIDILIDLSGHTAGNRLPLFACRPAPLQVTWLGYPNTTGLAAIDYRITDPVADPPGLTEAFHSEALLRLPGGFLCYRPDGAAPEVAPAPCLTNGYVTFGSFNNLAKVTDEVLALWAAILVQLPEARLVLKAKGLGHAATRDRLQRRLAALGVATERVALRPLVTEGHPLAAYNSIDIALDSFPYTGTTTTCDALWMGVPVVTLAGDRHVARVSASLLTMIGRPDLVAGDADEYIRIAVALGRDPARLGRDRQVLRAQMRRSILCDEAAFARRFEAGLRDIWSRHVASLPPEPAPAAEDSAARQAIETRVAALPFWYHRIELPHGVVTPGWAPLVPAAYGVPERLDGLRVLDLGAWDGYWSFEALRRGAREVVAIDDFSDYLGTLEHKDRRAWENFDLCRELLGYPPERCRRLEMTVYEIDPERLGTFDVVFAFGLLYHLRHPLLALDRIAALCTGSLHVESAVLDHYSAYRGLGRGYPGDQVLAEFYPRDEYGGNTTNWWVPTLHALGALLEAAGFHEVEAWLLDDDPVELSHCRGFARGIKAPVTDKA